MLSLLEDSVLNSVIGMNMLHLLEYGVFVMRAQPYKLADMIMFQFCSPAHVIAYECARLISMQCFQTRSTVPNCSPTGTV